MATRSLHVAVSSRLIPNSLHIANSFFSPCIRWSRLMRLMPEMNKWASLNTHLADLQQSDWRDMQSCCDARTCFDIVESFCIHYRGWYNTESGIIEIAVLQFNASNPALSLCKTRFEIVLQTDSDKFGSRILYLLDNCRLEFFLIYSTIKPFFGSGMVG